MITTKTLKDLAVGDEESDTATRADIIRAVITRLHRNKVGEYTTRKEDKTIYVKRVK